LKRLHPFQTPDTQRLAILFAVVHFAQGMLSVPRHRGRRVLPDASSDGRGEHPRLSSSRQKCFAIQSVCMDAAEWPIPDEPTVVFL
jgi:hypothetical protein